MAFWKEHTGFDDALVERYRNTEMTAGPFAIATEDPPKIEVAPSRRAAARRAKSEPATWTDSIDVEGIWQKWNAPRAVAQQSVREQAQRELHREPQPALDADEIYKRWNAPRQPAQAGD